ncbi:MAG: class I SAM-dependent methyltransferase [Gammaproteobacteria bacterium]|nr:class I SAM-dependent methyltransferase [Gammaproteobacteria bacterium]
MNQLKEISKNMIERYSSRYREMGYDIKTLGWGSKDQQYYRFSQTLQTGLVFEDKKILDIGCGFGDYANFLNENKIKYSSYHGVDINPDLINEAKLRNKDKSGHDFSVLDLTEVNKTTPLADVGVMLGLLNLNLKDAMDNYEYSYNLIKNALSYVNDALVVDFISSKMDPGYPEEDFIFYHNPVTVLEFALSISDNVLIKHDYLPVPQKEFMLVIYK